MRVATFNLHAGVDGWGRLTRVFDTVADLDADLYVLPELWRADEGPDYFEQLRADLGLEGVFAPLARGERLTTGEGGRGWQPRWAHLKGERGLFFSEHRSLSAAQRHARQSATGLERGTWGVGVLTRLPVESTSILALGRLPREKVERALVVAKLRLGERPFYVLGVHGAHLSHGSFLQYRRINAYVDRLDPEVPVLIGGDFNCWGPLLRVLLPGWQSLAKGRTWPAAHPHSQIDHVLGRGPWVSSTSFTRDGGSDHLALITDLELR